MNEDDGSLMRSEKLTRALRTPHPGPAVDTDTGFLKSVLRHLPDGVVVADERGKCLYANEAAEKILGVDLREHPVTEWAAVYGLYLPDTVTPFPSDRLPLVEALSGRDIPETEVYVKNADTTRGLWIGMRSQSLGDAMGGGVLILRDLTSTKGSQELVQRLSSVVEQTGDSVVITDPSGLIEYVNPAFETTTGYTREEVLGSKPHILNSGEHGEEFFRDLWTTLLAGKIFRGTIINRKRNGERYYSMQTITPMKRASGDTSHFVSVGKDITQVIRAAEEQSKMMLARTVQQNLYPSRAPQLEHFDVAGAAYPADATGGDYFDYIPMKNENLGIVIGDVSGHGIATALMMVQTRAYLRSLSTTRSDVEGLLRELNRALSTDMSDGHYVTLTLARLDPHTGAVAFSNAGHPPGYVIDRSGNVRRTLTATGVPMGCFPEWECDPSVDISLEPGELLVLFTDGITEAENPEGEVFGTERIMEFVRAHRRETSQDIVHGLCLAALRFTGSAPQNDDVTAIVCKALSPPG
jgi:sigma-B regulation protein RsbU (phosphoserine phosphatase)